MTLTGRKKFPKKNRKSNGLNESGPEESTTRNLGLSMMNDRDEVMPRGYPAWILLGPTGSGKTPLGTQLEERGYQGANCVHFDFGESLREVAARGEPDAVVSAKDIEFIRSVLDAGALLEDKDFPLAERLLISFLRRRNARPDTLVVMNGLPRHVGQAQALNAILEVRRVVVLQCSAEVVHARIVSNAGGDRAAREDDDVGAIGRKLEIYAFRTAPLVEFFQRQGIDTVELQVTPTMTAEQMHALLSPQRDSSFPASGS